MIVDMHCHLLPGVDDGPATMDAATEMAKQFVSDGTQAVFVTPHAYTRHFHTERQTVIDATKQLENRLAELHIPLQLRTGMEIHMHASLLDSLSAGDALGLGSLDSTRYILLELATRDWPANLYDVLYELRIRNITPIIAHPERYLRLQKDPEEVIQLIREGALLQITASAVTGQMGKLQERLCRRWLTRDYVHLIASDAHDTQVRKPGLHAAYERIRSEWGLADAAAACAGRAAALWG